jgi:hypothetical protein
MSTIYAWNDPATLTALDTSTADKVFMLDASANVTKTATLYDIGQQAQTHILSTSSNGATWAGNVSGIVELGTATAVNLQAPTKVGVWKTFTAGTSSIAYTVTATGSSFGGGTVWTGLGGAITFQGLSTSRWLGVAHLAVGSTQLT